MVRWAKALSPGSHQHPRLSWAARSAGLAHQGDTQLSAIPMKSGPSELQMYIRCRWLPAARCWHLGTWLPYRGRENYPQSLSHSTGAWMPGIPAGVSQLRETGARCNLLSFPMNETEEGGAKPYSLSYACSNSACPLRSSTSAFILLLFLTFLLYFLNLC